MSQAIVDVKNLSKKYGEISAVRDVSFSIEAGEVFGLLGPNGAGKSTTISTLTGLFPPIRVPGLEYLTPHYWSVLGLQNVISHGMGVPGALLPVAVLASIGVVCFLIGAARFKFE